MSDKVSEEQLDAMIMFAEEDIKDGKTLALSRCRLDALLELKARREAERNGA